jgi:hypothetical protein
MIWNEFIKKLVYNYLKKEYIKLLNIFNVPMIWHLRSKLSSLNHSSCVVYEAFGVEASAFSLISIFVELLSALKPSNPEKVEV